MTFVRDLFSDENTASLIVTFVSVVASGIVSGVLSRHYYAKANRDGAVRILSPIVRMIAKGKNNKNCYRDFIEASKRYEISHLSAKERKAVVGLADSLYKLDRCSLVDVNCDAITEFFIEKASDEGINLDEIVYIDDGVRESCGYRIEIAFLNESLHDAYTRYDEQIMENPERDINIRDSIIKTLNSYAKGLGRDIDFIDFSEKDIEQVLRDALKRIEKVRNEVREKTDSLLKLRLCKKMLKTD